MAQLISAPTASIPEITARADFLLDMIFVVAAATAAKTIGMIIEYMIINVGEPASQPSLHRMAPMRQLIIDKSKPADKKAMK
jgi:hypothetical protein